MVDSVLILLGEILSWSLMRVKGLSIEKASIGGENPPKNNKRVAICFSSTFSG